MSILFNDRADVMNANRRLQAFLGAVLVASTFAAYWTVFWCDFVSLDDSEYVYKNQSVLAGVSWSGWSYAWTSWDCSNWHPLTWLSLELDGTFWGKNPAGYHATSLVLHVVNSVLLFVVLQQLTRSLFPSAFVAGFFALHPLHVESVAWVSERKDVLSTLLLLLTIAAYVRYVTRPSLARYLAVLVFFALGLLAKPMLVTVPFLLLLLDAWPMRRFASSRHPTGEARFSTRSTQELLIEKIPFLGLAFADGLMTIIAQIGAVKLMSDVTFDIRIANVFNAYCWYLEKTFVPINLTIFYPHPERDLGWTRIVSGVLVFTAISSFVLWRRRQKPHLAFGWSWFVVSLLPVIGLIQVGLQAYADRYAYIPHIGLFTAIVWEIHSWTTASPFGRIISRAVGFLALVACGVATHSQVGSWRNNDALWTRAIEINPNNGFAHAHLADVRFGEGDYERAIVHIETGLRLKRSGYASNAYYQWGYSLLALNRPDEAEHKFLAALQIDPNHERALDELAKLLRSQGRHAEAAPLTARHDAVFAQRAQQQPENAAMQFRLGVLQAQQGDPRGALVNFERAVQLAPQSAEAHTNLAMVQVRLKLLGEAKTHLLKAIELKPDLAVAHVYLARLLESENDLNGAKKHLADAVRINPNDAKSQHNLDRLSSP